MNLNNNIQLIFCPILIISNILGISSVGLNLQNVSIISKALSLIWTFLIILNFGYIMFYENRFPLSKQDHLISEVSQFLDLFCGVLLQITSIILSWYNSEKFLCLLQNYVKIDQKFSKLIVGINGNRKLVKFAWSGTVIVFIWFAANSIPDFLYFVDEKSVFYILASYSPLVFNGFMKLQYVTCIYVILEDVKRLNYKIQSIYKFEGKLDLLEIMIVNKSLNAGMFFIMIKQYKFLS